MCDDHIFGTNDHVVGIPRPITVHEEHDWKRGKQRRFYTEYRCSRCDLTLVEFHEEEGKRGKYVCYS